MITQRRYGWGALQKRHLAGCRFSRASQEDRTTMIQGTQDTADVLCFMMCSSLRPRRPLPQLPADHLALAATWREAKLQEFEQRLVGLDPAEAAIGAALLQRLQVETFAVENLQKQQSQQVTIRYCSVLPLHIQTCHV